MIAPVYTIDPDFMRHPAVLRIAVLVRLRALATPIVEALQDGPLSCRDIMKKLAITEDNIGGMADLVVTLLQLQAFGLVSKSMPATKEVPDDRS